MKKTYSISELDCAVCANALEKKLSTITDDEQFESTLERVRHAVDHSIPGATLS